MKQNSIFRNTRIDGDGYREVITIGNESPDGCPFKCRVCGVHNDAMIVSDEQNKEIIFKEISMLNSKIQNNIKEYEQKKYHLLVYNFGNITNIKELSLSNFHHLLHEIEMLIIKPTYLSINTRGKFVTNELLNYIKNKALSYNVSFIFGVESLTQKGSRLYGKTDIINEFNTMFNLINNFNINKEAEFGLNVGFVFLPEFYSDDRTNIKMIKDGFSAELRNFITKYVGKNVPVKISIHPFYVVKNCSFKSSANFINILIEEVKKVCENLFILNKSLPKHLQSHIFIGLQDKGYKDEEWKEVLTKYKNEIEQINQFNLNSVNNNI
jgi:radical SAM superfamily enzyme YgiQ (UPF0313 family)